MREHDEKPIPESEPDPAHAPGKRRRGPPPEQGRAAGEEPGRRRQHQPWVPTSGLVGRTRRSARRG
jgi:hypothetical protein